MEHKKKPTIAELENILNGFPLYRVEIKPDGSLKAIPVIVESINAELLEALKVAFNLLEEHEPLWYLQRHFNKFKQAIEKAEK